jgi:NitT/TauT family transport system substrate-binding protein
MPMSIVHTARWSRREFLGGLAMAGTTGLLGLGPGSVAAEPPPETTQVRLVFNFRGPCTAPLHLTEAFLHGEGFSEVQYLNKTTTVEQRQAVASGEAHLTQNFLGPALRLIDAGDPIVLLAGIHVGCLELVGNDRVRAIRDLKGKTVAVPDLGGTNHVFLSSVAAYVGLDPRQDITWVTHLHAEAARLMVEGKIDALLAGPPEAQMLRAQQIGHVILNTMMDRPWSQYFCCMVTGNREFVRKYPVATKRALRAIFRAVDRYTGEPELLAWFLVDRGYRTDYDFTLQALQEMGMAYGTWRQYEPEDAVRFYALRLHEVGMLKSSPQKLIAHGTDWRFLNELKKELKG